MQKLNFPTFAFRFKITENKTFIFDRIRKKFLLLTPEEWVRQHWVYFLLDIQQIPISMLSLEKTFDLGQRKKRFDLVVYQRNGKLWMLIECKQSFVEISQNVFDQIQQYQTTLKANHLVVSNGINHHIFNKTEENKRIDFLTFFPKYQL